MSDKEIAVKGIFESIQDKYDFLDSVISFGMDEKWRKIIVDSLNLSGSVIVLDCGAGTGKLTKQIADRCSSCKLISLDITEKMFRPSILPDTKFIIGSAENIPLEDSSVDRVVSAFLTRNLDSVGNYFKEAYRVLKKGGIFINLDIYNPRVPIFKQFFALYFFHIVPFIGDRMTKSKSYSYLAQSVKSFHSPETISKKIRESGFRIKKIHSKMLGSINIHISVKD